MWPGLSAWCTITPATDFRCWGETAIQPDIVQTAATLTAIGIGTAFGVLLLLTVLIVLIRMIATPILSRAQAHAALAAARAESDTHDRALAAVVGVSALLAAPESGGTRGGDG